MSGHFLNVAYVKDFQMVEQRLEHLCNLDQHIVTVCFSFLLKQDCTVHNAYL